MSPLSDLTELTTFGVHYNLLASDNATLILGRPGGQTVEATDLMSAYGSVNFGHRNPAIAPFADAPADIAACFCPVEAQATADWLCEQLGTPEYRVLFQVGGSFAVSAALALAHTARPGRILVVEGGFHGLGVDALAASREHQGGAVRSSALLRQLAPMVDVVAPGDKPRCWSDIACFLFEPVQGANGYVPLDHDWLREMEAEAHQVGAFTIADEIQCGFFRHGPLSPSRACGLLPDALLYSKSLTNGLFPLSAVVYSSKMEEGQPEGTSRLAHTFQTSALGYYAAAAVTRYADEVDVPALGGEVALALEAFATRLRNTGVAGAIHRVGATLSFELAGDGAGRLVRRCATRGVLCFTGGAGGRRVRIAPPLTIPRDQLAAALAVVGDEADELTGRKGADALCM